jgi:hypothetical protein
MDAAAALARQGWVRFAPEPATRAWAEAALASVAARLRAPAAPPLWRHGGTWHVGVDALPNDPEGRVRGGPPLAGRAVELARALWPGALAAGWHAGQVSALRPGYPGRDPEEGEAAHRFRLRSAGAHLDGLIADAAGRRRVAEPHAFVFGIGLTAADPGASPLVVWEGSHRPLGEALRAALAGLDGEDLALADVTEAYRAARAAALRDCPRRALALAPGEAVLLHRHLVHGIAPWAPGAAAPPEGRAVAYFRPLCPGGVAEWLAGP